MIGNSFNNIFEIDDTLRHVLFNLTTKDLLNCNQVNIRWHQITNEAGFWSHFIPQELKIIPQDYKNCINCCAVTSLEKLLVRINKFSKNTLDKSENGKFICYFPSNESYNEICLDLQRCQVTVNINFDKVNSAFNNTITTTCLFIGKLKTSGLKTVEGSDGHRVRVRICMPTAELSSPLELKNLGLPALVDDMAVEMYKETPFAEQVFNIAVSVSTNYKDSVSK
jgi:hypothetical protein